MTTDELKPCPMCGGSPNKPAKNGGSDERSGYNFTVTVACKCGLRIDRASHQGKQGWCDDSGQAEAEAIAAWNSRAQPAAPSDEVAAVLRYCRAVQQEGTVNERVVAQTVARMLAKPPDAAPSVAPEPVAWRYQDARGHYRYRAYKPGFDVEYAILKPVPLYEAHPPRAPLTEEHVTAAVRSVCPNLAETSKAWRDLIVECRYWLEAAHGIGGK